MLNLKYIHVTLIYILFMSIISHIPNDSLPDSDISFSAQDKIFHLIEFLVLGILLQLSFIERSIFSNREIIFMTVICGFSIACIDELHQSFVIGRHSSINDLVFDFLGLLLSFLNYKNFY